MAQDSKEWNLVERAFKFTMPNATITKLEKIKNTHLREVFEQEMKYVRSKYGAPAEVKYLFHGTSQTDPNLIFRSEEGFDMRFSSSGMWGKAVYFA